MRTKTLRTNIIIIQVKMNSGHIEGMNGDSDRRESSEKKPQVNPTKLDNSEALNLSCSEGP